MDLQQQQLLFRNADGGADSCGKKSVSDSSKVIRQIDNMRDTIYSLEKSFDVSRCLEAGQWSRFLRMKMRNVKLSENLKEVEQGNTTMLNLFRADVTDELPQNLKNKVRRSWQQKYDALLIMNNKFRREIHLKDITIKEKNHEMDESELDTSNDLWNIVWRTFENASLTYDLASSGNGTKIYNIDEIGFFDNPTKLGIVTGLFLAWLAEIHIIPVKLDHSIEIIIRRLIFIVFNVSCSILLAPIIALILICFFIYRQIIHLILRISVGREYMGLLEGTDCVWAVEDSSALSVINVLAILEVSDNDDPTLRTNGINVLEDFRNLVKNRLISSDFDKLWWLREKKYGYYYWRKSDYINLEERVRWLDNDDYHYDHHYNECNETCDGISDGHLRRIISRESNKPLPRNHKTCWEMLIVKQCDKSIGDNCSLKKKIRLLFRVHHTLGDGVALLRILLEAIADTKYTINYQSQGQLSPTMDEKILEKKGYNSRSYEIDRRPVRLPMLRKSSSLYGSYRESSDIIFYSTDLLGATMPFSNIILLQTWFQISKEYLREFGRRIAAFVSIPSFVFYQAFRSMDISSLHGTALTGHKIISGWMEDDYKNSDDYSLLAKIRDIKNITGTKFGDVVLTALSVNINNYFLQNAKVSPKTLTVVIPARMTSPSKKLSLKNGFSVGLLPLCISEVNGIYHHDLSDDSSGILERLRDISTSTNKLKSDPDYLINYWIMKWLCAALPEYFLKPFLHSNSTMVFSNLPGPQTVAILGHTLRKVAFWIPHRGTTGIGFSFLSYGGKVSFSVSADKAVVNDENVLNKILRGTIHNIEQLHKKITLPCFGK